MGKALVRRKWHTTYGVMHMKKFMFYLLLCSIFTRTHAQIAVTDAAQIAQTAVNHALNYAEHFSQTLNQIEQINNQIAQLEAMDRNSAPLSQFEWENIEHSLQQLLASIQQVDSITYDLDSSEEQLEGIWTYDQYNGMTISSREENEERIGQWSKVQINTFKNTIRALREQFRQIKGVENTLIAALQDASHHTEGRMEALQVGHQISVAQIRQMQKNRLLLMDLNNTIASYYALEESRKAAERADMKQRTQLPTNINISNGGNDL